MLSVLRPDTARILAELAARTSLPFSYPHVGATATAPPSGWRINHLRCQTGKGRSAFDALAAALFSWKLLAVGGLEVFPSSPDLQPGTAVAIRSRHFGLWSLDFCRVIYVLRDQPENHETLFRTGFAYGTLPGHAVRGEEIFSLEWHPASQDVWYEIYSFSLPATPFVRLISPIARATQRRFARASLEKAAHIAQGHI
jgi:uncharacterized protein (UPF0548 family)